MTETCASQLDQLAIVPLPQKARGILITGLKSSEPARNSLVTGHDCPSLLWVVETPASPTLVRPVTTSTIADQERESPLKPSKSMRRVRRICTHCPSSERALSIERPIKGAWVVQRPRCEVVAAAAPPARGRAGLPGRECRSVLAVKLDPPGRVLPARHTHGMLLGRRVEQAGPKSRGGD